LSKEYRLRIPRIKTSVPLREIRGRALSQA
jgi:hypothetical protein